MRKLLAMLIATLYFLVVPVDISAKTLNVKCSAYALRGTTASGVQVGYNHVAVSRDLKRNLKLQYGDLIYIHGIGMFTFTDLMHWRWRNKIDMWLPTKKLCFDWGVQKKRITIFRMKDFY